MQHRVDPDRGAGGGAPHQRLPEVVRAVARRLHVLRLHRGADHVERRQGQDQREAPAPAGLAERQVHAEDHHVDVVGREPELREVLPQVADRQPLGQRAAEVGADRMREGGEDRVEMQPAERHVDGGQRPRDRLGRLHRVAAEGEVDQVVGEVRPERDQAGGVGVLDLDHRQHRGAGEGGGRRRRAW